VRGLASATNGDYYDYKCFNNYFQLSVSYRLSRQYQ
jgi:hypothetical protein